MKMFLSIFLFLGILSLASAREYTIFSISQNFPMSATDKVVKKNYFINMGVNQGIEKGTIIDVTRTVAQMDPYDGRTRYEFQIKVGELKILHVEGEAAIAKLHRLEDSKDRPYLEIEELMIGDEVKIHLK